MTRAARTAAFGLDRFGNTLLIWLVQWRNGFGWLTGGSSSRVCYRHKDGAPSPASQPFLYASRKVQGSKHKWRGRGYRGRPSPRRRRASAPRETKRRAQPPTNNYPPTRPRPYKIAPAPVSSSAFAACRPAACGSRDGAVVDARKTREPSGRHAIARMRSVAPPSLGTA